jgi:glucosamine--fructose-6-phosphate aminotransferase (isomerizing)
MELAESIQSAGANTLSEILSEPQTWKKCLAALDVKKELGKLRGSYSSEEEEWVFVGCGSSYYLALIAAATWSLLTDQAARAIPASEILLFPKVLPRVCRPILISRSGRTSEIIQAGNYLMQQNQTAALAITCGRGTPIEGVAAQTIVLPQADEKSTVMTRSFTSMVLALQLLAAESGERSEVVNGIRALPDLMEPRMREIDSKIYSLASAHTFEDYVFLGQGPFHGVAQEAMLKVKEMSCSYAQCFHTLEFRHGPKASVSPETLVTFFLSESGFESEVPVLQEIKELGATTLVVTNEANAAVRESADYLIELSLGVPEVARAAAAVIPGQLLGFHTGMRKGFNPDNPRHLSRVVMLESSSADGDSRRGAH